MSNMTIDPNARMPIGNTQTAAQLAGGSADASDAAGETLPDDNIAQYGSGSDDE